MKPEMSPNVNYLYQVVMLDHNYSSSVAPMPAVSPTVPVSSAGRQQQQQPVGINGVPGMSPGYHTYHGTASGKSKCMIFSFFFNVFSRFRIVFFFVVDATIA